MRISLVFLAISIFTMGWLMSTLYSDLGSFDLENPLSGFVSAKEVSSPAGRIAKEQIHVYEDRIVIDLENAKWAEFTNSNSMDPVLDVDAHSFEVTPQSAEDIKVGDIISYKPTNYGGLVVHRVIGIAEDEEGWYAVVKGDNLSKPDPEKVRFEQINGVLVGIVY